MKTPESYQINEETSFVSHYIVITMLINTIPQLMANEIMKRYRMLKDCTVKFLIGRSVK